jgi:membrane associated rhomboid family serine protease
MAARRTVPLATAALVVANLATYGWERAAIAAGGDPCGTFGLVPERFLRNGDMAPIFGATFLHASLVHLAGNLAVLALLGTVAERALGHLRFLTVFLSAGIVAGLMHVAVNPAATAAMVGASGPIFSLLPIVAVVQPRTLAFTAPYVVFNLLALVLPDSLFAMPGVALGAHIGGFVCGALVVMLGRAVVGEIAGGRIRGQTL